jgi:hypothetical protein
MSLSTSTPAGTALRGAAASPKTAAKNPVVPQKPWLVWLAWGTFVYLLVEISFNARLLDVAGGQASAAEIEAIEKFGRIISGAALTLAVWGALLLPRLKWKGKATAYAVLALVASATVSMNLAYHGEKALIDMIVERSDGAARRDAALLALLSSGLRHGHSEIDGLGLTGDGLKSPEGKAFVALFPMLAYSTEDLVGKTDEAIESLLRGAALSRLGSGVDLYNQAFIPSVEAMTDLYNRYVDGVNRTNDAFADAGAEAEKMWTDYLMELSRQGIEDPSKIRSNGIRQRAVRSVQQRGIAVPDNWIPNDRITFQRAARQEVQRRAVRAYEASVEKLLGAGVSLPNNLTWDRFVAHPSVQKLWKDRIGAPGSARLDPDMSFETFRRQIHEPLVARAIADETKRYEAKTPEFADGGRHEGFGRNAVRAMVVPPIALAISLLGAMVHVFKLANMVSWLGLPKLRGRRWRAPAMAAAVSVLTLAPLAVPNAVTSSRIYGYLEHRTSERLGPFTAIPMTWVVQMQPYAYPVNEFVRRLVLLGYGFGYEDRSS